MKKLSMTIALLALSAILVLTVSAELSPTNEVEPITILDGNGNELDPNSVVIIQPEDVPESSDMHKILEDLEEKGASAYISEISPELEDHILYSIVEVETSGDIVFPLTITFQVPGITSDDEVIVIHYLNDGWELITPDSIGTNTVTATFTSLSPVGLCIKASDTPVSPSTGDFALETVMLLGSAAVIVIGASAYLLRRGKKENIQH